MTLEWYFEQPAESLLPLITARLNAAGYRVQWTFNLQTALALAPDCTCPHHSTARCDCQCMVLVASDENGSQETLLVHGHDAHSWVVLATQPGKRPREEIRQVVGTLCEQEALNPSLESTDAA